MNRAKQLDIKRFIGPPLEDMMQVLLQSDGGDRVGQAVAPIASTTAKAAFSEASLIRELAALLEEMRQAGLWIYLANILDKDS